MAVINNASGQKSNAKKVTYSLPEYEGEYVLKILSKREVMALLASIEPLSWIKRHDTLPEDLDNQDKLDAWADHLRDKLMQDLDLCQIIQDCIGAQLTGIENAISNLQTVVNEITNNVNDIEETQQNNAAHLPEPEQSSTGNAICGASLAVVEEINGMITGVYQETEAGPVDTFMEKLAAFIRAVPILGELPLDEMLELLNNIFEQQAEDYTADYNTVKNQMICDLTCFVYANSNTFDWDVWGQWLVYLGEQHDIEESVYFGNRAALLFARFAPIHQTFLNQIAAIINKENSLQAFFDTLMVAWNDGLQNSSSICESCGDCPLEQYCVTANSDPVTEPFSTEYVLTSGLSYTIGHTGVWNGGAGPDYPATGKSETANELFLVPGANVYRMVFRIGESGDWFATDDTFVIEASSTGILYVALNDIPGGYTDNTGEICITIEPGA